MQTLALPRPVFILNSPSGFGTFSLAYLIKKRSDFFISFTCFYHKKKLHGLTIFLFKSNIFHLGWSQGTSFTMGRCVHAAQKRPLRKRFDGFVLWRRFQRIACCIFVQES